MKKVSLIIYTLLFLFVLPGLTQAQNKIANAEILLKNGSTLHGQIKYGDWFRTPERIDYYPTDGQKNYTIEVDSIASIDVINENKYVVRKATIDKRDHEVAEYDFKPDTVSRDLLLRVIVSGKLCLYEYINAFGRVFFFVEKNNAEFITLDYLRYTENSEVQERTRFRNQLSYYIQDCEKLNAQLPGIPYKEYELKKLVAGYNRCQHSASNYSKKEEKTKVGIGVWAGLSYNKMAFNGTSSNELIRTKFSPSLGYMVQASLDIPVARRFQKHHVVLDAGLKVNIIMEP